MTERERLIELLNKAEGKYLFVDKYNEAVADYLLENGVVVLPLKIGQELWDIHYNKPRKFEVCYIGYNGEEWFVKLKYFINKNIFSTIPVSSRYLNKHYFLTKEEAEKALEDRLNERE